MRYLQINLAKWYKKSSVSAREYDGHFVEDWHEATDALVDLSPNASPNHYKTDSSGPGVLYKEKGATDVTAMLQSNGGSNVFIRKSDEKKRIKPSLCPKTHCPPSFQYSIG